MAATRTTQQDMLRTVYTKYMQVQFNLKSVLLQYIGRNTENYAEGKEISVPLHAGQTGGWGYSDAGTLPPAGEQLVRRANFNYRRMYGTIEIDGPHVEGAAKPEAAERRPYDFETKNLVRQMRAGANFDLFQDGTGIVGIPSAFGNPAGAPTTTATTTTVATVQGLVNNMIVDILLTATGATAGGVVGAKISVNQQTGVITLLEGAQFADGSGATIAANFANYSIYRHKSRNQAPFGLQAIVTDANPPSSVGVYGGIDRTVATNEYWQSIRLHNSGTPRTPTPQLVQDGLDAIDIRGEGSTNLIICGHRVWQHLVDQMVDNKRWNGQLTHLNQWAEAIMFGSIPIVKDKHCPISKMYLLDTSSFEIYQNDDGKWMDQDGAILSRVEGRHAYRASWFRFWQLVCYAPNQNAVIEDLVTTAP